MQVLDAKKLWPALDAASIPASNVFEVPASIVMNKKFMQAYMQPNSMKVLDAEKLLPVLNAASVSASKLFQVTAISLN